MRSLGDGGMDLPFEGQDRTDLTDDFLMSGGVVVLATTVPVEGREEPALIFRFASPEGQFYAPILLVVTDEQMSTLIPLVTKAVKAAITEAHRKAS